MKPVNYVTGHPGHPHARGRERFFTLLEPNFLAPVTDTFKILKTVPSFTTAQTLERVLLLNPMNSSVPLIWLLMKRSCCVTGSGWSRDVKSIHPNLIKTIISLTLNSCWMELIPETFKPHPKD